MRILLMLVWLAAFAVYEFELISAVPAALVFTVLGLKTGFVLTDWLST